MDVISKKVTQILNYIDGICQHLSDAEFKQVLDKLVVDIPNFTTAGTEEEESSEDDDEFDEDEDDEEE
jgi:hypothetical protein